MVRIVHARKEDTHRHEAPADDPLWQESLFLGWYDAHTRCGGSHHISLCPHLKLAHVWTWLVVDGVVVARSQENALTLPSDDLRDMRLGVLHFVAGESVRQLGLTATFEEVKLEVSYDAFTDPVELDFSAHGMVLGSKHYESMGRVHGAVTHRGRKIDVSGSGWQDHSWGPRKFTSNPAGRWIFAAFGFDLAFSVFSLGTPKGILECGYVLDTGVLRPLVRNQFRAVVADDGISPSSCDARVWTQDGRGYRMLGEVDTTALTGGLGWSGGGAFWAMDGLARFECGGRLGEGILEVSETKIPTEAMRARLKLG